MIREILTEGDPRLNETAREVGDEELATPAAQRVIDDLIATLKSTTGVGLAAPQIGEPLRVVIVDKPLTVLVNPVITPVGDTTDSSYEGCLSVPGMRGEVTRHQTVRVQATDRRGKTIDAIWTKFRAIVVQHEVDHLNGILYTSRAAFTYPDDSVYPAARKPAPGGAPVVERESGSRKTFVLESGKPVGGTQHFTFTFHERGRVTDVRIDPGGAIVTGAWLSGVRLKRKDYKAGAAQQVLCGDQGLHVASGDQLRVELRMPKGRRPIRAEADLDG